MYDVKLKRTETIVSQEFTTMVKKDQKISIKIIKTLIE